TPTPPLIITAGSPTTITEAMALLIDNRISCLPVVNDQNEIIGIISDKDIFRAAYKNPGGFTRSTVGELMTTNLIVGVADDELDYIAGVMTNNRIRHVPIVDNRCLIGLLSLGDIVKSQLTNIEIENRYLRKYINDEYPG
ncbi:MAG: CBS domain-containing protein, partial [Candidatus Zixiibacteriota bacterium]